MTATGGEVAQFSALWPLDAAVRTDDDLVHQPQSDRYSQWKAKGAQFLTEPLDNHGPELRCYMRDPDGYLMEVGQYSQAAIDAFQQFIASH